MSLYETVVGLEIHVELATESKVFCGCSTKFGGEPNTKVCPVCMGLPGSLPRLNEKAVEYALRAGLALNCEITRNAKFDRKHYFYPDLPKAYQISQLYLPLCVNGYVDITGKRVNIREIHMEEDAGKLVHDLWTDETLVDFNRCGVPLIEIVTQPDMRTADEVVETVRAIRAALAALGVSDVKMQEGSMRVDVNLSVREFGHEFGTRTEMKNINSLKSIARAVAGESKRQIELIETGKKITQETRRWDDNKDTSYAMRVKEDAHDYRYMPDPDLSPFLITEEQLTHIRRTQPELPEAKRLRYPKEYGLSAYDTDILISERTLCVLFEGAAEITRKPKDTANWIIGEVLSILKERGEPADELSLDKDKFARIITLVADGAINRAAGRRVLRALLDSDIDVDAYVKQNGLEAIGGASVVDDAVKKVVAANADSVAKFRSGSEKVFGFLMGQVMKELKGKGDPAALKKALEEALL
ncbi:MAG: Asp-tRNA(Asn)/Glu-tRNA(Gln) amidotransferase subunit GatB [Oscillospiraceae bacterium]|jgi:aspartyl-tRNA(Asn)/glutamyl-tRNA(Gln) amidotransferase subunit B|nr:Asp-tRNA(Asn)/Glu-tRNA(Gln) amidotransferase subunit GatB [Oscillospiraceae bacterium]